MYEGPIEQIVHEAEILFGKMREATADELKSVSDYIKSISKPSGENFSSCDLNHYGDGHNFYCADAERRIDETQNH